MSATTATTTQHGLPPAPNRRDDAGDLQSMAAGARREAAAGLEAARTATADVGEKMPELLRTARMGATDGARSIQSWPEPTRRTISVFSLGLGVGLMIAGAPRLLVGGALLPALAVAASTLARETGGASRPL